jgi:SAM-dependent methyltransferase
VALRNFAREYRIVRRAEGWGSPDPAYYRALPYRDLTGRFAEIWQIRARSYDTFIEKVLSPLEARSPDPLSLLDLGAGSGWLAYRLVHRGHHAIALDILEDPLDGLTAIPRYAPQVHAVLAEFDELPFPDERFDLAVFNASLHYSTDYVSTIRESLRVLRPRGTLVILDSPMYSQRASGDRMVKEREQRFLGRYGFASNAVPSQHYLTPERLEIVASALGLCWHFHMPALNLTSRLSRTVNGLRARREPARFPVIVGTKT